MCDEVVATSKRATTSMFDGDPERSRGRMTLDDFVGSRDNNFNLIRFLAASAVLLSHSYALSTGDPATEPLRAWLGFSTGDIAGSRSTHGSSLSCC